MTHLTASQRDSGMKAERLLNLARLRQQTRWSGHQNIGDYHGGRYECDYVSPYTKSASNIDCSTIIMLQDWASDGFLGGDFCQQTADHGRTPTRPTNVRLDSLVLRFLGFPVSNTYATNLFPFIKNEGMNAHLPTKDLVLAAQLFGVPQIEIIVT